MLAPVVDAGRCQTQWDFGVDAAVKDIKVIDGNVEVCAAVAREKEQLKLQAVAAKEAAEAEVLRSARPQDLEAARSFEKTKKEEAAGANALAKPSRNAIVAQYLPVVKPAQADQECQPTSPNGQSCITETREKGPRYACVEEGTATDHVFLNACDHVVNVFINRQRLGQGLLTVYGGKSARATECPDDPIVKRSFETPAHVKRTSQTCK